MNVSLNSKVLQIYLSDGTNNLKAFMGLNTSTCCCIAIVASHRQTEINLTLIYEEFQPRLVNPYKAVFRITHVHDENVTDFWVHVQIKQPANSRSKRHKINDVREQVGPDFSFV